MSLIAFLKDLTRESRNKKCILIRDGLPGRKSKKHVRQRGFHLNQLRYGLDNMVCMASAQRSTLPLDEYSGECLADVVGR